MPKIIDNPDKIILKHAKQLLSTKGVKGLNVRTVAKSCNVSVGTIYNYFPKKESLILQIVLEYWEDYLRIFDEIDLQEKNFLDKLRKMYEELDKFFNHFRGMWLNVDSSMVEHYKEYKKREEKSFNERLTGKLEKVIEKEKICDEKDTHEIAEFITLSFIMLAQTKQFEYEAFEKILKRLL